MIVDKIDLPDPTSLEKEERGHWVCYFKGGKKHSEDFHRLLKKSGIISFGASNYKDTKKVYYVTKYGGVFSIPKKDFNDVLLKKLSLARFISDGIISRNGGRTLEENITMSYEVTF